MSTAVNFFALSQEELDNIVQNEDDELFDELASERVGEEKLGATTDEFSRDFFKLAENHPIAQLLYTKSKEHEVLEPMASHGNTRLFDHDAVSEISQAFGDIDWEVEITDYCEEHNQDFEEFRPQVWAFNDIKTLFAHAKDNQLLIVFYSE